jgi:hypothetical protein
VTSSPINTPAIAASVPGGRADVLDALKSAAANSGVEFGFLLKTAMRESGLNPGAKAGSSSATGLFQFTEATWMQMVDRYGGKHGVPAGGNREAVLALRNDPDLSAKMAAELTQENARHLEGRLGRAPNASELYAAHFLGAGGAAKLIEAAQSGSAASAADLFPAAAQANPAIFKSNGQDLSPAQVLAKLQLDAGGAVIGAPQSAQSPDAAFATAQLGGAQMASALMSALLDIQSGSGLADAFIGSDDKKPWKPFGV